MNFTLAAVIGYAPLPQWIEGQTANLNVVSSSLTGGTTSHGRVAQMAEHRAVNLRDTSSSLVASTSFQRTETAPSRNSRLAETAFDANIRVVVGKVKARFKGFKSEGSASCALVGPFRVGRESIPERAVCQAIS